MADGTVRGTFDLNAEPAKQKLRSLRQEADKTETAFRKLGDRMDSTAGKTAAAWSASRRAIADEATRIEARVDRLENRVQRFGRQRSSATVELAGVDRVLGQIALLERRLSSYGRQRSTATAGLNSIGGGGLGGGGGAGSAGGGGGGGLGTAAKLALGGAVLLPGIQALGVSSAGLLGSASGAALGGATIAGGGVATVGVGAGLTAAIAKPAVKELQELQKETTKYAETVRKYGEASKQAAVARRELAHAEAASPGAGVANRQLSLARQTFRNVTGPARQAVFGAIGNAALSFRGAAPTIGRSANIATAASAGAATNFASFLGGTQTQTTLLGLSKEFARDVPLIERSLENVATTVEHLAMAARPFFHEAAIWTEAWTHGLASNTGNEARVQSTMRTFTTETKDWGRLTLAAYHTIRDIFNMGRPSGDSMVHNLTETLDRWDSWIQRNPAKVRTFFDEAQTTTEKIASALTSVVHLLSSAATALQPLFNRAAGLIRVVGALGPGGTTALSAAAYGGFNAFRGGGGGGGGSTAGGVARTAILGRPYRSGGGVMVGSAGAAGAASTAGTTRYLLPSGGAARAATGAAPLFITRSTGEVVPNISRAAGAGAATPEGFAARYGGIEGAHYAAPVSTMEAARGPGRFRGAVGGAAKTVGATLAIMAALESVGRGGSPGEMLQNFGSSATLGLINPVRKGGSAGTERAGAFLGNIPTYYSAEQQRQVVSRKLAREFSGFTDRPFLSSNGILAGSTYTPGGGPASARTLAAVPRELAEAKERLPLLEATGGGKARNRVAEIKATIKALEEMTHAAHEARKAQNAALELRSEQHATQLTSQLGQAFGIERAHGTTAQTAFGDVTKSTLGALRSMHPAGQKILAENTLAWARQLKKSNPELAGPINDLTQEITDRFKRMGKDIQIVNGHILTGSAEDWQRISTSMSEPIEKAREKMSKSFTAIQREAVAALVLMGFNKKGAEAVVSGQEHGGKSAGQITQGAAGAAASTAGKIVSAVGGKGNARGGMIGGRGLLDTVPVPGGMAAPGEAWIANRHTLADISAATVEKYGLTAQQMITSEHRAHSQRHAYGGALSGVRSGVASVAGAVLSQFPGLSVTSTTGGGHAAHSLHYLGEAVDLAGSNSVMLAAAAWAGQKFGRELAEGIHNPNLSIKSGQNVPSSFWGPAVWAEHANHIHLGVLGGGGALGAAAGGGGAGAGQRAIHLKQRRSGLPGVPGMLADAGISKYRNALQSRVNSRLGGSSNFAGVSGHGGAPSANERLGREMMLAAGWGANEWPALKALWTQESGWDANSVNSSSGAYGIPQALGHGHPFALGDARGQIAWGLNYIRGRYGSPSGAEAHERSFNWYSRGGRAAGFGGWHAAGGDFLTNGPTLFGAGEGSRRERVSVTPVGQGQKGGHSISVEIGHITMHTGGKSNVDQVAKEVAAKILDAMDEVGANGTGDRDLIAR